MRDPTKESLKTQKKRTMIETCKKVGVPVPEGNLKCKEMQAITNRLRREYKL